MINNSNEVNAMTDNFDANHLNDACIASLAILDGNNKTAIPENVLIHLSECLDCREKLIAVQLIEKYDYSVNQFTIKEKRNQNVNTFRNIILAAASVLVFIVFTFLLINNKPDIAVPELAKVSDTEPIQLSGNTIKDSMKVDEKKKEIASIVKDNKKSIPNKKAYTEIPYLEQEIKEKYRNITTVALVDAEITQFQDSIIFDFINYNPSSSKLSIRNNSDEEIYSSKITGNRLVIKHNYPSGLYYWFITNDTNVLRIGKFKK